MAGRFSAIFITLCIFQTCHSTPVHTFQHLLEEKIEDLYDELVKPVITEMSKLNQTLQIIEKDMANRTTPNVYLYLLMNTDTNNENDESTTCKNLTVYLPKAKEIIENAFHMCIDVTGTLSDVLVEGFKCLDINIFKTIPCLLRDVGNILRVYKKYKPELLPIILELKKTFTIVIEMYKDCIKLF